MDVVLHPALVRQALVSWQASKVVADLQIPAHPEGSQAGCSSPAVAKSVLWPIAEAARPDGSGVTLSVATIARRTQLGRTAVLGGLKLLEWAGIIERKPRFHGAGRTSDEISLSADLMANVGSPAGPPGSRNGRGVVHEADQGGSSDGPQEPVLEPMKRGRALPRSSRNLDEVAMAPTWEPPEDAYEFGASIGLTTAEVERETAKFREWHLARTSSALSADWAATWRLWMRRASEFKPGKIGPRQPGNLPAPGRNSSASLPRWDGPEAVRAAVVSSFHGDEAKADTWLAKCACRDLPERALVVRSALAMSRLQHARQALRRIGFDLLLERAA